MDKKLVIGEGDCYVIDSILPPDLASRAYQEICEHTEWVTMMHKGGPVPRLISVQGCVGSGIVVNENGSENKRILTSLSQNKDDQFYPLYRHPTDAYIPCVEFLSIIKEIRKLISTVIGQKFNHALIQFYRTGSDIITEHSDKTLDIEEDTLIVNLSLGYIRTMTLRTKRQGTSDFEKQPRKTQKIELKDNSLFILGPVTNQKWLHGIRADKTERGRDATGASGRISLTFRSIGTYVTIDGTRIFGQGTPANCLSWPLSKKQPYIVVFDNDNNSFLYYPIQSVVHDDKEAVSKLYQAFSLENKTTLSRGEIYSAGSNVLTRIALSKKQIINNY